MGEIYWVHRDPGQGSEIRKTRPGLVVSNDLNNVHASTVTVLPITTEPSPPRAFEVPLLPGTCGNKETAKAKASQIRTVDKVRLGDLLGAVPPAAMSLADAAMKLHLGMG